MTASYATGDSNMRATKLLEVDRPVPPREHHLLGFLHCQAKSKTSDGVRDRLEGDVFVLLHLIYHDGRIIRLTDSRRPPRHWELEHDVVDDIPEVRPEHGALGYPTGRLRRYTDSSVVFTQMHDPSPEVRKQDPPHVQQEAPATKGLEDHSRPRVI